MLRAYVEHDQLVYLFNLTGQFDYVLEDMTELAGWVTSGMVMMLDVPPISKKNWLMPCSLDNYWL